MIFLQLATDLLATFALGVSIYSLRRARAALRSARASLIRVNEPGWYEYTGGSGRVPTLRKIADPK